MLLGNTHVTENYIASRTDVSVGKQAASAASPLAQVPGMVFACKVYAAPYPPGHQALGESPWTGQKKSKSLEPFSPPRRSPRRVPAQSVTVAALDHDLPFAYGVVANISDSGVCVQMGEMSTRRGIHVMLSFSNGEMLDASGRVVWSKPLKADGSQMLFGIEFTGLPEDKRETLRTILDSPAFT